MSERIPTDDEIIAGEYTTDQLLDAVHQLDDLREALIILRDCNWVITLPDRMDAVRDIAREALGE